jgi:hypothetical protein
MVLNLREYLESINLKNINVLEFHLGNNLKIDKDTVVFNTRYNSKVVSDLIPVFTSLLQIPYQIYKSHRYCYYNITNVQDILINNHKFEDSQSKSSFFINNLINHHTHNLNVINNDDEQRELEGLNFEKKNNKELFIKEYNQEKTPKIYFGSKFNYHYEEKYIKYEWNFDDSIILNIHLYRNYATVSFNILLQEKVKIIPNKKENIVKIFDKIIKILSNYELN